MKANTVPSRKLRISVPGIDEAVLEWVDAQHSLSHSFMALVREAIQRDGVIDAVHKPVSQQPRRGRPPGEVTEVAEPGEPRPTAVSAEPAALPAKTAEPAVEVVKEPQRPVEAATPPRPTVAAVQPAAAKNDSVRDGIMEMLG